MIIYHYHEPTICRYKKKNYIQFKFGKLSIPIHHGSLNTREANIESLAMTNAMTVMYACNFTCDRECRCV